MGCRSSNPRVSVPNNNRPTAYKHTESSPRQQRPTTATNERATSSQGLGFTSAHTAEYVPRADGETRGAVLPRMSDAHDGGYTSSDGAPAELDDHALALMMQTNEDRQLALAMELYYAHRRRRAAHRERQMALVEEQRAALARKSSGLSAEELDLLPTYAAATETECQICMEDATVDANFRMLPCMHSFHTKCVDEWLEGRTTCPGCSTEINLNDDERVIAESESFSRPVVATE